MGIYWGGVGKIGGWEGDLNHCIRMEMICLMNWCAYLIVILLNHNWDKILSISSFKFKYVMRGLNYVKNGKFILWNVKMFTEVVMCVFLFSIHSPFFTLLAVKLNVFCLFSGRLMYKFRCCQVDFHFDCPDECALSILLNKFCGVKWAKRGWKNSLTLWIAMYKNVHSGGVVMCFWLFYLIFRFLKED